MTKENTETIQTEVAMMKSNEVDCSVQEKLITDKLLDVSR